MDDELKYAMDALDSGALSVSEIAFVLVMSRLEDKKPSEIQKHWTECMAIVQRAFREGR